MALGVTDLSENWPSRGQGGAAAGTSGMLGGSFASVWRLVSGRAG